MDEKQIFQKKIDELLFAMSGKEVPITPFVCTNGNFDIMKAITVSKELAKAAVPAYGTNNESIYNLVSIETCPVEYPYTNELYTICENYYYIALSICYFFEKFPGLDIEYDYLFNSKTHFKGIEDLIANNHFNRYLFCKKREQYHNIASFIEEEKAYQDKKTLDYYDMLKDCNQLSDLQYYEKNWTNTTEYFEGIDDFIKLMYILCKSIINNGILPNGGENELFSENVVGEMPPADWGDYLNPDFACLIEDGDNEEEIIEEFKKQRLKYSNDYCIDDMSKYINAFPEPKHFLDSYVTFRKYYLNIRLRSELPGRITDGVSYFLTQKGVSLYSNDEYFKTIYRYLYATTRLADDFIKETLNTIEENQNGHIK